MLIYVKEEANVLIYVINSKFYMLKKRTVLHSHFLFNTTLERVPDTSTILSHSKLIRIFSDCGAHPSCLKPILKFTYHLSLKRSVREQITYLPHWQHNQSRQSLWQNGETKGKTRK